MPTMLAGVVSDAQILADQRKVDMSKTIAMLEDDVSPLTVMLSRVAKRSAHNQTITWLEDELGPRLATLTSSVSASDTWLVMTSSAHGIRARDVLFIPASGENMAAISTYAASISVTRSIGSPAAASAATSNDVIVVGNAAPEGARLGVLMQTLKVKQTNYTQIQRHPWGFTNTALASDMYGGDLDTNERGKKFIEHRRAIENTLFWGRRDLDTTNANSPIGYMGGVFDYVTTNVTTGVGTLTAAVFENWLQSCFRYGSRNKVVFVTPLVQRALNSFPMAKLAIDDTGPGVKRYGIQLMRYLGGGTGGEVQIVVKRDWSDFSVTGTGGQGGQAICLDMDELYLRPLQGRDTQLLPKRQDNDEDAGKAEYLTECSLELRHERNHGRLSGITGY